jgi:UDP-N-acetylglucosamine 2-epimerase (non-hydrolysing)
MTVVGTRPELIRLSPTIGLLDEVFDHSFVHTGQNHSPELNDVFFGDLGLRQPDYYLGINTASVGTAIADVISKMESVLREVRPEGLLVLGDTNSAFAALIARRMGITVYHWEAGNRSFDPNVPEEINRRVIDHLADFNIAYSEQARRNLVSEGLPSRRTFVSGSPMAEILSRISHKVQKSEVLNDLKLSKKKFVLASFHRQENVDSKTRLTNIIDSLKVLHGHFGLPVVVSLHPRTEKMIAQLGVEPQPQGLVFLKPLNFTDFTCLQMNSMCVVSDSGTISEEAAILGVPAVTIRDSMERPEALETGTIVMTGLKPQHVLEGVQWVTSSSPADIPVEYKVTDASRRVVSIIQSTLHTSASWDGLRSLDS